ncbi:hypothetical protein Ciccas_010580, partial [Cichlidogyrus casuarinus]
MKVTVSFDDVKVVVPCGFGDLSVRELLVKAVCRFKNTSKKLYNKQRIVLYSAQVAHDGGILDWNDPVADVLDDRELVIAKYRLVSQASNGESQSPNSSTTSSLKPINPLELDLTGLPPPKPSNGPLQ